MVVPSRLPKAGNTSKAGDRGLVQWYQSHGPDLVCQRGRWAPERGVDWEDPTSGVEENEPHLISLGIPQPFETPFEDKIVTAGMLVASRPPKADNTSKAGGRGLLQWHLSHGPDSMCQRGRWAPERGWIERIPHRELRRTNHAL